jgi:hypothetical protein
MTIPSADQTNRLLGYPADARLLLVNADDFGMCHAVNAAIIRTLQDGIVRSSSIMRRALGHSTRSRGCKQRLPFPLVCI